MASCKWYPCYCLKRQCFSYFSLCSCPVGKWVNPPWSVEQMSTLKPVILASLHSERRQWGIHKALICVSPYFGYRLAYGKHKALLPHGFINSSYILLVYQSVITLFALRPRGHECYWAHQEERTAKADTSRLSLISAEYQVPEFSTKCQSLGLCTRGSAVLGAQLLVLKPDLVLLCCLESDCNEESFVGKCCEK